MCVFFYLFYFKCVRVCVFAVDADTFPEAIKAAVPPGLCLAVITLMSVLLPFTTD